MKGTFRARFECVLRNVPLIDGHNDLAWQIRKLANNRIEDFDLSGSNPSRNPFRHTDIKRLRAGMLGGVVLAVYLPPTMEGDELTAAVMEEIDIIKRLVDAYKNDFELATTAGDITRIYGEGKIACMMGIEGGHMIQNSLDMIQRFYAEGVRYITLTYTKNTEWADSANDTPLHHGLTPFGKDIVREMNCLGMLVDLSHVSDETMRDALEVSKAPLIFSHSGAREKTNNLRNVPDNILERLAENNGIIMMPFVPYFISPQANKHVVLYEQEHTRLKALYPDDPERIDKEMGAWIEQLPRPEAALTDVADHIDHIRSIAGIEHIGIGSDFEGFIGTTRGLEDVSCYPELFEELMRRGYTDDEIACIAGGNFLRVLNSAENTAKTMQGTMKFP